MKTALRSVALFAATALSVVAQYTETPVTIAPGAWLLETDVVNVAYDRHTPWRDGVHYRSTYLGYVQLTTGVLPNLDVQLGLDSWREERASDGVTTTRAHGMGELYLRAKWQVWQKDEAGVALLPYVALRGTAHESLRPARTQFGVVVPWAAPLGETWWSGGQMQVDWLDDGAGGREEWLTATVVAGRALTEKFGCYFEAMTYAAPDLERRWATLLGGGVTWQVSERFYWDLGCMFGCSRIAPDISPVLRFGWSLPPR